MFVLSCPSCHHEVHVKFARLGATATCLSCKSLFNVDAATLRSDGSTVTAAPAAPGTRRAVSKPVAPSAGTSSERPRAREAAAPAVRKARPATPRSQPPRPESDSWSPITVAIVAAVALAAALAVGVFVEPPPKETATPDAHPLPDPLVRAMEDAPDIGFPGQSLHLADQPPSSPPIEAIIPSLRVKLTETAERQQLDPESIALEAVESRIGLVDDANGESILQLALRNPTAQFVRDPRLTVELVDDGGGVIQSWHGTLEVAVAPGQTLEFEAAPPMGMGRAVERLVLRAYASPLTGQP